MNSELENSRKKNIWLQLATIAGKTASFHSDNLRYWNGFMRLMMSEKMIDELEKNHNIRLPNLTEFEEHVIKATIQERGFPRGIDYLKNTDTFKFSSGDFNKKTNFSNFVFPKEVKFGGAEFKASIIFDGAVFLEDAVFEYADFQKNAKFDGTFFYRKARFNGATFHRLVSFRAATFGKIELLKAKFLFSPPAFFDSNLSQDISWDGVRFPELSKHEGPATIHRNAYECLALLMSKLEKHHDRHAFFRLEMRARRVLEKKWFPKALNYAYEALSDYGYGIYRAAKWWAGNIAVGTIILLIRKDVRIVAPSHESIYEAMQIFTKALATSFSNAHGFFGMNRGPLKKTVEAYQTAELVIPFNVIAVTQTIIGAVFLFFLLLCSRNRFRMN